MAEPVPGRVCHYGSAGEPWVEPIARGPLQAGVTRGAHKDLVFWAFVGMYQCACGQFDLGGG